MKIIKHKTITILTGFLLGILLTACGGGQEEENQVNNSYVTQKAALIAPRDINFTEHEQQLYINWSAVRGAQHYKVYISRQKNIDITKAATEDVKIIDSITLAELAIKELETNIPYFVVVTSVNANNEEVASPEFRIVIRPGKIVETESSPTNFEAKPDKENILLSWDVMQSALSYQLYYSLTDPTVDPVRARQITDIATRSFLHKNLPGASTIYYRLSALTSAGISPLSNVIQATTSVASEKPQTPKSFTAIAGDGLVALSWEPVDNASSYTVYMAQEPGVNENNFSELKGGEVNSNIVNVSSNRLQLPNDITYFFSVASVNSAGASAASQSIAATPKAFSAQVPFNVKASSASNAVRISWSPVAGASKYSVYWSSTPDVNPQFDNVFQDITSTSLLHENLRSGEPIHYFVTAHNENNESNASAIVSAIPVILPDPPSAPASVIPQAGENEVQLSWPLVSGAEEYVVYLATEPNITRENYFQLQNNRRLRFILDTKISIKNLLADTDYYFAIAAINAGGEGQLSSELKIRTIVPVAPDRQPPVISTANVQDNASSVALNKSFAFEFSEALAADSINDQSVVLQDSNNKQVSTTTSLEGSILLVTPLNPLTPDNRYELRLKKSISDTSGNQLDADQAWSFTTASTMTKPVITLLGDNPLTLTQGDAFVDPGASATDAEDGDLSQQIRVEGVINTQAVGEFTLTYSVVDSDGMSADAITRQITIIEGQIVTNSIPVIKLLGANSITLIEGQTYTEAGAQATDNEDGDLTEAIRVLGEVNSSAPGNYTLFYNVSDSVGNNAIELVRLVTVLANSAPEIRLTGDNPLNLYQRVDFVEPGFSAFDKEDGNLSANVQIVGVVDSNTLGTYVLRYNVKDSRGKAAVEVQRTVNINNSSSPIIIVIGSNPMNLIEGDEYADAGATASDAEDGNLTQNITINNSVDTKTPGTYQVRYNVVDSVGQAAIEAVRTVVVFENQKPQIILKGEASLQIVEGTAYIDAGAVASDAEDGDISSAIEIAGSVDIKKPGNYRITYSVTDKRGRAADVVIRTVEVVFNNPPSIVVTGSNPVILIEGDNFTDTGATSTDVEDGNLTEQIKTTSNVDTNFPGTYQVRYNVVDIHGKSAIEAVRNVEVLENQKPQIILNGEASLKIVEGVTYFDAGAVASDAEDGDLSAEIKVTDSVDVKNPGIYYVTFNVIDKRGRPAVEVIRFVEVVFNNQPLITVIGSNSVSLVEGDNYTDAGATATDVEDGDLTSQIKVAGSVDANTPGTYQLHYSVSDSLGKTANEVIRTINVIGNQLPVIKLNGENPLNLFAGEAYVEPGAVALDKEEGDISSQIQIAGVVDANKVGSYSLSYNVKDSRGKNAVEVQRVVNINDSSTPIILIIGSNPISLIEGDEYVDAGATASDAEDGNLTHTISMSNNVDSKTPGTYQVRYNVVDSHKKSAIEAIRTVVVLENQKPQITLNGKVSLKILEGVVYIDAGAVASDAEDGDISAAIEVSGSVDINKPGIYPITFTVADKRGRPADEVIRTVEVVFNNPPSIVLTGSNSLNLIEGDKYTEAGATATDVEDGNLTAQVKTTGSVDINTPGTYQIRYNVSDSLGKIAVEAIRTVNVIPNQLPVIILKGQNPLNLIEGETYIEPGALASDKEDGDLTQKIQVSSNLDNKTPGAYQVLYNVSDSLGLAAKQVTRNINVIGLNLVVTGNEFQMLNTTQTLMATAKYSNETSADVTSLTLWSSSDSTIANVSNNAGSTGLITTKSIGDAVITASYKGKSTSFGVHIADLSPPSIINAIAGTEQIELDWGDYFDGDRYDVFRSEKSPVTVTGSLIASVDQPLYLDRNLLAGKTYFYAVRKVINYKGIDYRGALSKTVSAIPNAIVPDAPVLTGVGEIGKIKLKWAPITGAVKYLITYKINSEFSGSFVVDKKDIGNVTVFEFALGDQFSGNFSLVAVNKTGQQSLVSNSLDISSLPPVPATPTGLQVTAAGDGQVSLAWNAVRYAQAYSVYVGFDKNVSPTNNIYAEDFSGTTATLTNLSSGGDMFFVVTARNSSGESAPSSVVTARLRTPANLDLISDAVLRKCVANAISESIFVDDLRSLNCLEYGEVATYKGIEQFVNLESLITSAAANADLSALSGLSSSLLTLELDSGPLVNIDPLSQLTGLQRLVLDNSGLTSGQLIALSGLQSLVELQLNNNSINDIAALGKLLNLKYLSVNSNHIQSLEALSALSNLNRIEASNNLLRDISYLAAEPAFMSALQIVNLSHNLIHDASPLVTFQNLKEVNLIDNLLNLNVGNLNKLEGVTLYLDDNPYMPCIDVPVFAKYNQCYSPEKRSGISPNVTDIMRRIQPNNGELYQCLIAVKIEQYTLVHEVTELPDCVGNSMSDLNGIELFKGIGKVILPNHQITDSVALVKLPGLTDINLSSNYILNGVDNLLNLTHLKTVNLRSNPSLPCAVMKTLDVNIDSGDGKDKGNVLWSTCGLIQDQVSDPVNVTPLSCGSQNVVGDSLFQSFVPSMESLKQIQLDLLVTESPLVGYPHSINLREGHPLSPVIAKATATISRLSRSPNVTAIYNFAQDVVLVPGKTYVIEFPSRNKTEIYPLQWYLSDTDNYLFGAAWLCNASEFPNAADRDMAFKTLGSTSLFVNTVEGNSKIYRMNVLEKELIYLGDSGVANLTDIAQLNGTLYAISFSQLFSIDKNTGVARLIGNIGFSDVNALTSDGELLYAATTSGSLLAIDPFHGIGRLIGFYGNNITSAGDLVFANYQLLASVNQGDSPTSHLAVIDPFKGSATIIGSIGFNNVYGLGSINTVKNSESTSSILFGATSAGELISINQHTGAGIFIRSLEGNQIGGMSSYSGFIQIP